MHRATRVLKRFFRHDGGQFALISAMLAPPILMAAAMALETNWQTNQQSMTQNALDAAVIAGAAISGTDAERIETARNHFFALVDMDDADSRMSAGFRVDAGNRVTGSATYTLDRMFGGGIFPHQNAVELNAVAEFASRRSGACIYVLANVGQALLVNSGANIQAPTCDVQVHSTQNPAAIFNAGTAINVANLKVQGSQVIRNGGAISNLVLGATVEPDPYAGTLPEPAIPSSCRTSNVYNPGTHVVLPGLHCAPIYNGASTIRFEPGLHIVRGRMIINAGSTIIANGATFYFVDTDSEIRANGAITMEASAPSSGPYEGVLMFEKTSDPANNANKRQYIFNGSNGEKLEGLIYLPNRDVTYNSTTNIDANKTTLVVNTMIINSANWKLAGAGGSGPTVTVPRLVH